MAINSINGGTLLESGYFPPCRVATTGPITLSGLQTIDGIALAAGDRVLVWQQADSTTNGIYAAASGPWVRTTDASSNTAFFDGMRVAIAQGATNAAQSFQCTTTDDPVIIGSSQLTFQTTSELQTATQSSSSTTSLNVGTGSKTLNVAAGLAYQVNQWLLIFDPGNALLGQITAYNSISGVLTVSVVATSGSGTHSDWTVVLTNSAASAGLMPPIGTGNVTGPGSSTTGHVATFADGTGKVLSDGGVIGTLAARAIGATLYGDLGTSSVNGASLAPGVGLRPFIAAQPNDNLVLSNDGTNPTRDIDISPGRCPDMADTTWLQLAASMVKRLDQAWAAGGVAGAPVGALDSGSSHLASKTYHIYLIGNLGQAITQFSRTSNVATVTVAGHGLGVGGTLRVSGCGSGFDALAAISAVTTNTISYANTGSNLGLTASPASAIADGFDILASQQDVNGYPNPVLPSGWTVKQAIGSVLTDGSANNRAFSQLGDEFLLAATVQDQNPAVVGNTAQLLALTVPIGVKVISMVRANAVSSVAQTEVLFTSPDENDQAATVTLDLFTEVANQNASGRFHTRTNAAGQIRARSNIGAGANVFIDTFGWRDPRRRLF